VRKYITLYHVFGKDEKKIKQSWGRGRKSGEEAGGRKSGRRQGGEMAQTMYAYVNK
jgi:hypothetical protein